MFSSKKSHKVQPHKCPVCNGKGKLAEYVTDNKGRQRKIGYTPCTNPRCRHGWVYPEE